MQLHQLTTAQLKEAIKLEEQIEAAQAKLDAILGTPETTAKPKRKMVARTKGKRRTMSAEGRAKIAAAQKARWAKIKG